MFEKLNNFISGTHNFEFTVETLDGNYIGYTRCLSDACVAAEFLASFLTYSYIEIKNLNGDVIKAYDL